MRVSSLGTDYKPNFGYSAKANKKLRYTLAQDPDVAKDASVPNSILRMSELCNKIEDQIILQEGGGKKPGVEYTIPELSDTLINMKSTLVRLICTNYPKLDYMKEEIDDYEKGSVIATLKGVPESENWRRDMVKQLVSPSLSNSFSSFYEKFGISNGGDNGSLSKEMLKQAASLVEEFKPTSSSPNGFKDVKGMNELKEQLTEMIVDPLKNPAKASLDFEEYGKEYPGGILLYGPPGCGKTYITQALAQEANVPMYSLRMGKIGSKYIHETSNNYELVFDYVAQKAKEAGKPCIMFIDEFESVAKSRDDWDRRFDLEEIDTLLNLIQTAKDRNIVVVAATNVYDLLDEGIKRRFDEQVYVGMPDFETRELILSKNLASYSKGMLLRNSDNDMKLITKRLEGFSNDDICKISAKAARKARIDGRRDITAQDYYDTIALPEVQARKIREDKYKHKTPTTIGFAKSVVQESLPSAI